MRVTSNDIHHAGISPAHGGRYLILITAALFLVALLDHATGDFPVQHLYYLPIIFAATRFGRRGGLIVALASVVLYHLANPALLRLQHDQGGIVQIILFFTVGIIAAKLADDAKRMRLLATTDDLTGLHNLRSFESHLARFVNQAQVNKSPLSMLVLDLDRLKSLNDEFGHLAGAEAVRTVGHLIAEHIPPTAVACRYGGDEFVIALPEQTVGEAVQLAEALRQAVHGAQPMLVAIPFPAGTLSISVGVAGRLACGTGGAAQEAEALFHAADRALYSAKKQGRNRVCAAREEHSATRPLGIVTRN
jgi:diguanylate cyclase (GGDEF)-like protein